MSTANREHLLAEILGGRQSPLGRRLEAWLGSRRFSRFVEDHLPKVRKKVRSVQDQDSARDLLLELETAYRLVGDKRFKVVYEPVPRSSARGPDFAVTYTAKLEVMLESTRLRGSAGAPRQERPQALDAQRFATVLGIKLGQLVVDRPNVLLIGVEGEPPAEEELVELLRTVRQGAESAASESLMRQGFRTRGDYFRRLAAVSAIVVRRAPDLNTELEEFSATWWLNPATRTPLPNDVRGALIGALTG